MVMATGDGRSRLSPPKDTSVNQSSDVGYIH